MAADGGYREGMRRRMAAAIELHQPADAGLLCVEHLAAGELEDWPCDEARYAVMVQGMLQDRERRPQR